MTAIALGKIVITPRGNYNAGTPYVVLDAIVYEGSSYIVLGSITGITPTDDGVNYQLLAQAGQLTQSVIDAINSATAAASSASTSAGTASTAASTSSTQAGIASTSATSASTSAGTATTEAGTATTQAGNAATSATASASSATASASSATASAASVGALTTDLASTASGKGAALVAFLQSGTGAVARTVQDKSLERVTPFDFGAVGDGVTDDTAALNNFFAWCSANKVKHAVCTGSFGISATVSIGPATGLCATLHFTGSPVFIALSYVEQMVIIQNCVFVVWDGKIRCNGGSISTPYASRLGGVGVTLTASQRFKIGGVICYGFTYSGLVATDNTNNSLTNLGDVTCVDCGSGCPTTNYSLTSTWGSAVNAGASANYAQTTTLAVGTLPPTNALSSAYGAVGSKPMGVFINGVAYYILSVDSGAGTISIFPWPDNTVGASGTLTYIFGGGVVC